MTALLELNVQKQILSKASLELFPKYVAKLLS